MAYRATEKTQANKLASRDKILKAAKIEVLGQGFYNLTMSKVALRAKVATGTLYRHFSNKHALCIELFCQASGHEVEQLKLISQELALSPVVALNNMIECFLVRAFKGPRLAWSLIAEPLDPALESQRLNYRQAYAEVFERIISLGIAQQHFAAQDAKLSATALVGALAESLVLPLSPQQPLPSDTQQQDLIKHMQNFCRLAMGSGEKQIPAS